ncbi:PLD nuclease N-terminal domain-containing protein [Nesterenkonia alkaliphila]|uniref:Cardiolipin synthase N-terminal domain-containing protein n=1 Tax=Nesterenkonia alkaliphila TaxID=1463631 RepID=A0A7K1UN71_9MICC|nr:PLD nuclease N-terminal domain-containing protein [Nesterenkonia alkaliphila]MVT27742.1 hypothetical protein [Nesterenkonia alkaliphila]GFZ87449.1 hypothetical protein GCM10011359_15980 [Nesterenkonia alkaliphila]
MVNEALTEFTAQTPPGSVAAPWWLSFAVLVYGALLVAAFMIYAQTDHQGPAKVIWVLIIALVPILGAIIYFIAQSLRHRRENRPG